MTSLRREVGFWGALGRIPLGQIVGQPEFLGALSLGIGGPLALLWYTTPSERASITGDFLVLVGPLLGIVFAGFALVVIEMSADHIRWLNQSKVGIKGFLSPFMIAIGLQVGVLIGAVVYRAIWHHLPPNIEKAIFVTLSFLFVYAVLDVVALARNLFAHGMVRAGATEVEDIERARQRRRDDPGRETKP